MADLPRLSEETFTSEVLQSKIPVLVDFTAVWCGPCKMLDPIIKDLAQQWAGKVKVTKLDVDESPNLAMEYGVMGVPTLMLFVNGQAVQRISGYQPKDKVVAKFSSYI